MPLYAEPSDSDKAIARKILAGYTDIEHKTLPRRGSERHIINVKGLSEKVTGTGDNAEKAATVALNNAEKLRKPEVAHGSD